MKAITIILMIISATYFSQPYLYGSDCPDYEVFFKETNPAKKSWKNLYKIYKETSSLCDDGIYGEGYSDFVVQSLAKYWSRFGELLSITKKDPSFRNFILRHIDATTDLGDLEALSKNVREKCPASEISFCKDIDQKARAAIEVIKFYDKKE